jgi:hypothetical protein
MPRSTETCIFDFYVRKTPAHIRAKATTVREPIDQMSNDRGALDPLIILSLLHSESDRAW